MSQSPNSPAAVPTGWHLLHDGTVERNEVIISITINVMSIWDHTSDALGPVEGRPMASLLCAIELAQIAADATGTYRPCKPIAEILETVGLVTAANAGTYRMATSIRAVVRSMLVLAADGGGISIRNPITEYDVPAPPRPGEQGRTP